MVVGEIMRWTLLHAVMWITAVWKTLVEILRKRRRKT